MYIYIYIDTNDDLLSCDKMSLETGAHTHGRLWPGSCQAYLVIDQSIVEQVIGISIVAQSSSSS
jgi:hypothetical protein